MPIAMNDSGNSHGRNALLANQLAVLQAGHFLFTSESVGEGHPGNIFFIGKALSLAVDKLCDQISDAILDACLSQDPLSRVACETAAMTGMIVVFGEITSKAVVDFQTIARKTVERIGYDDTSKGSSFDLSIILILPGLDYKTCSVMVSIHQQSSEISHSVDSSDGSIAETGAGDQGIMFGYATDETDESMPLTLVLAHRITAKLSELRRNGQLPWLRPDCKSQVTVEYKLDGGATVPLRVHTVVLSTQHSEMVTLLTMRELLLEKVIKAVIPHNLLDDRTKYHIQPSGSFLVGGPQGDAGLTGRKIIVDSYGGWGAHGGGAFSGKDWTKVDRSATYAARWIAKSLVAAKLARRCLIQVHTRLPLPFASLTSLALLLDWPSRAPINLR